MNIEYSYLPRDTVPLNSDVKINRNLYDAIICLIFVVLGFHLFSDIRHDQVSRKYFNF